MGLAAINEALRERLGPDVWAKGILAAISQDASIEEIHRELSKASPDEIKALAREIKHQSELVEVFTNMKPAKVNGRGTRLIIQVKK
jgi:hypothetical protein